MGVAKFLTDIGLFIGQSPAFFEFLRDLAEEADKARRGEDEGLASTKSVKFAARLK